MCDSNKEKKVDSKPSNDTLPEVPQNTQKIDANKAPVTPDKKTSKKRPQAAQEL